MESSTGRFVLAIALVIGVFVVTNIMFPPAAPPPGRLGGDSAAVAVGDMTIRDTARRVAVPPAGPARPDTAASFAAAADSSGPSAATVPAETVYVATDLYRYGVSTSGAGIVSAELGKFQSFTREGPVQLVADSLHQPLVDLLLDVGGSEIDLARLSFQVVERPDSGAGRLVLRHPHDELGPAVEVTYDFAPDHYVADVSVRTEPLGAEARLLLRFGPTLATNEIKPEEDRRALAYVVNSRRDGINSVRLESVEGKRIEEGPLLWVALKNKYFLAAAVAGEQGSGFGGLIAEPGGAPDAARLTATLPGQQDSYGFRLYLGPQEYSRLSAVGEDLEDVNPYGWKVFRPIVQPLAHLVLWALNGLHGILGLGYGWVLILFGVLIRIVQWPLSAKAMRSQLKTMELQPVVKEIQARHKDNPEKLQKEMMRLYKEEGFNPLGGCLPMLIPWPVLITLFFVFQNTIAFRGQGFLWLPDLSQPDPLFILPIILGGSMFALQWLNLRVNPQANQQMKIMTYVMPIMMVVIFFRLASGLNLYYAASNLLSVPQQLQIMGERRKVKEKMTTS